MAFGTAVALGALVGFGVGHGAGAVPGAENSFAAIARIAVRSGACESPNEVFFGWTSGERMTTLVHAVRDRPPP